MNLLFKLYIQKSNFPIFQEIFWDAQPKIHVKFAPLPHNFPTFVKAEKVEIGLFVF